MKVKLYDSEAALLVPIYTMMVHVKLQRWSSPSLVLINFDSKYSIFAQSNLCVPFANTFSISFMDI
jgi:hypothetical protein